MNKQEIERIKDLKDIFNKKLENYELDKKFGQLSIDSVYSLFPIEIKLLLDYINQLETNRDELKKWLRVCLEENNKIRLYDNNSYQAGEINTLENVIDKMQELERGKE